MLIQQINYLLKNKSKKQSILPVLFGIALLSLFSETLRTVPAGAKSENFRNLPFELPSLNSDIFEEKFINKNLIVDENSKNYDFLIEENFTIDNELVDFETQIDKFLMYSSLLCKLTHHCK